MPGLNQNGPLGQGPLSGGQRGICAEKKVPTTTGENMTGPQPEAGFRGGAGCRRRGGSGRGAGQGVGQGRRTGR